MRFVHGVQRVWLVDHLIVLDWGFKKATEWRNTCVSLECGPIFNYR